MRRSAPRGSAEPTKHVSSHCVVTSDGVTCRRPRCETSSGSSASRKSWRVAWSTTAIDMHDEKYPGIMRSTMHAKHQKAVSSSTTRSRMAAIKFIDWQ